MEEGRRFLNTEADKLMVKKASSPLPLSLAEVDNMNPIAPFHIIVHNIHGYIIKVYLFPSFAHDKIVN